MLQQKLFLAFSLRNLKEKKTSPFGSIKCHRRSIGGKNSLLPKNVKEDASSHCMVSSNEKILVRLDAILLALKQ